MRFFSIPNKFFKLVFFLQLCMVFFQLHSRIRNAPQLRCFSNCVLCCALLLCFGFALLCFALCFALCLCCAFVLCFCAFALCFAVCFALCFPFCSTKRPLPMSWSFSTLKFWKFLGGLGSRSSVPAPPDPAPLSPAYPGRAPSKNSRFFFSHDPLFLQISEVFPLSCDGFCTFSSLKMSSQHTFGLSQFATIYGTLGMSEVIHVPLFTLAFDKERRTKARQTKDTEEDFEWEH